LTFTLGVATRAPPRGDLADDQGRLAGSTQRCERTIRLRLRRDDYHAEAAVERLEHFHIAQMPGLGEPGEYARRGEGAEIDARGHVVRQHARHVLRQSATSDVRQRLDGAACSSRRLDGGEQRL